MKIYGSGMHYVNTKTPRSASLDIAIRREQRSLPKQRTKTGTWETSQRGWWVIFSLFQALWPYQEWELTWIGPVGVTSCPPLPHYARAPRTAASSEARLVTRCNCGGQRWRSGNPLGQREVYEQRGKRIINLLKMSE